MTGETTGIVVVVLVAFSGYVAAYLNNLLAERRKEKLAFINKQITSFYGPLYVVAVVGRTAYEALVVKLGRHHEALPWLNRNSLSGGCGSCTSSCR